MNFFADRMTRTMDEMITVPALLDNLPASVVNLPAEWAMAGSYFCPDKGQRRVSPLTNQVENLAVFCRNDLADIAGPGNIGIYRSGFGSFGPEIDQEQRIASDFGRPRLWR